MTEDLTAMSIHIKRLTQLLSSPAYNLIAIKGCTIITIIQVQIRNNHQPNIVIKLTLIK